LSKKWASAAGVLASMSKSIEKRMWSYENPLKQSRLQTVVLHNLERYADEYTPAEIAQFSAADLGELIKMNEKHGQALLTVAKQFPSTAIRTVLRPLSHSLLQVNIAIDRNFEWNTAVHGHSEPFYVWLEDHEGLNILQWCHITLKSSSSTVEVEFIIPVEANDLQPLALRVVSDRWVGSEETLPVPVDDLVMPSVPEPNTPLLNIPLLPINVLQDSNLQTSFSDMFTTFNGMQSQAFWTIYHTAMNVLFSAPNSSGKATFGEIASR
jgi:antiviral helicase SLH1